MKERLKITKDYYINFLIKMSKEVNYHEDFNNLNIKKFKLLNELTNMKNCIEFNNKKFKFININKFNNIDHLLNKNIDLSSNLNKRVLLSNYDFFFNSILEKMKQSFLIQDYIKLETNSILELSIESLNLYEVDKEISNYSLDIKNKYKKVLTNILDILISKEEILFDVEIKDKKQISLLNKKLCDLDYM